MIDFLKVFKTTTAYKILQTEKKADKLSHAYLLICQDKAFLSEYLKIVAKIIMCENGVPCLACRDCSLIENNSHSDVIFYPKGEKGIVTDDVNNLIEESFIKPIESNKKIFILQNAEQMNVQSQNKLLKTLEEPPKNVFIILGATTEYPLLSTVKSRVKKLEIAPLGNEIIIDALKEDCVDKERLKEAVLCGDGTVGKAVEIYDDASIENIFEIVKDVLINMKTSRDVLTFINKINKSNINGEELLNVFELVFSDMLYIAQGKKELVRNKTSVNIYNESKGFSVGALLSAIESITEAKKRKYYKANDSMLLEWFLFRILEGKYKWQKL